MPRGIPAPETEEEAALSPDGGLPGRCPNCAKRFKGRCRVLTERIGLARDCWAWTDDPGWAKEAARAKTAYRTSGHWRQSLSTARRKRGNAR